MDVMEDVKKSPDDGEGIVPSLFALVMVLPKAVADVRQEHGDAVGQQGQVVDAVARRRPALVLRQPAPKSK